jgi:hypothetical protein
MGYSNNAVLGVVLLLAYVPIPNAFEKYIRRIPYMHDEEYVETRLSATDKSRFLVLP